MRKKERLIEGGMKEGRRRKRERTEKRKMERGNFTIN